MANEHMPTIVDVIINASSGASDKEAARRRLADVFAASGVEARISLASGSDVTRLARDAAKGDAQAVVAGGGDGTVNAVASMLVGTAKPLGILPLGTLNHFAKDLRIPLELTEAARTIVAGHAISVDVGEVNDRIFLNNSSLGLYPSIVRHREMKQGLGHGKWPAFLWAAFSVLRRYPFLAVRLIVDDKEFVTRTPFVFIGNNVYEMEGLNIGTRAQLDARVLSLHVTKRTGRWGLVRLALRAFFRRLQNAQDFIALTTTEVRVETRRKSVRVSTDGEVSIMKMPLHYRVRPGALCVFVPEESEGTK